MHIFNFDGRLIHAYNIAKKKLQHVDLPPQVKMPKLIDSLFLRVRIDSTLIDARVVFAREGGMRDGNQNHMMPNAVHPVLFIRDTVK